MHPLFVFPCVRAFVHLCITASLHPYNSASMHACMCCICIHACRCSCIAVCMRTGVCTYVLTGCADIRARVRMHECSNRIGGEPPGTAAISRGLTRATFLGCASLAGCCARRLKLEGDLLDSLNVLSLVYWLSLVFLSSGVGGQKASPDSVSAVLRRQRATASERPYFRLQRRGLAALALLTRVRPSGIL